MHSVIRTHRCGLDRTPSNARRPIYSNLHRDSTARTDKVSLLSAHICRAALSTDKGQLRTETFASLSAAGKESPGPLLTPVRLHTQLSSESRPPSHWSTHRPAPPKDRGSAVRVTVAMNPREPMVSSPKT